MKTVIMKTIIALVHYALIEIIYNVYKKNFFFFLFQLLRFFLNLLNKFFTYILDGTSVYNQLQITIQIIVHWSRMFHLWRVLFEL